MAADFWKRLLPKLPLPLTLAALAAVLTVLPRPASAQTAEPYALGADISWIPEREANGVRYAHNGQVRDIFDILKEHKFNYIRLRLFVDPTAKIQGESESPYSARGYCGTDSTIKTAKRAKAAGMKLLLDFHYSDTWADPGKQYKPVSWEGLNSAQLAAKVRSYTKETLERFKNAGVLPDMVQIGNETVGGMIWPDGKNSNWANFAALVNAGIDGVKDVDAGVKIMVHTINDKNPSGWLANLKNAGAARIDVIGLSYYTQWHGQPDSLQRTVKKIADNHNIKIAVAEYSGNHRRINDIIFNLPDNKGFGTFVWEPADWNDNNYGAVLFDWKNNRRETNEKIALYPVMAADYGIAGGNGNGDGGTTGVIGNNRIGTDKKDMASTRNFRITRWGAVYYNSDVPGVIAVYGINGRALGKIRVDGAGIYDVSRLLRPGVCMLSIESNDGKRAGKLIKSNN